MDVLLIIWFICFIIVMISIVEIIRYATKKEIENASKWNILLSLMALLMGILK